MWLQGQRRRMVFTRFSRVPFAGLLLKHCCADFRRISEAGGFWYEQGVVLFITLANRLDPFGIVHHDVQTV